jgi:hypothetical protein
MNASILFAPSIAKKDMLAVVRKTKRFLPKRRKYLVLRRLAAILTVPIRLVQSIARRDLPYRYADAIEQSLYVRASVASRELSK